jgi:CRISPR-associated protein Cas5d
MPSHRSSAGIDPVELLAFPSYIALRRNEVKEKISVASVEAWARRQKVPEPIWADGDRDLLGLEFLSGMAQRAHRF